MRRIVCLLLVLAPASLWAQMGPLSPSSNPSFFKTPSGKTIVLAGSQTWNTFQDMSESTAPEAFDFNAYVAFLVAHGHNATILWRKDLPTYCNWGADGGGSTWHITLWPWPRTGSGTASDGLGRFDLSQFNQAYFDRLRTRVQTLQSNNIYAIVELFDGLGITANRCSGDGYPFSGGNNIQGISDDSANSSMTMSSANAITAVQDAYVQKVIDTLHDLPNVLWEISEEAPDNSTWWQGHMISLIHTYEQNTYGVQHPVGYPTLNVSGSNDSALYNSNADWVAPAARFSPTSSCGSGTPRCKVNINDSDHSYFGSMWTDSQQTVRNYIWENFTNGNGVLYMDPYTIWWPSNNRNLCDNNSRPSNGVCSAPVSTASGWQENVRRNLGYIVTYGNTKLNLANDTPQPSLCQTGFCLAHNSASGAEFLVYFPSGGAKWVNLSVQNGQTLKVEWFSPAAGSVIAGANYTATSAAQQSFTPPSQITGDAVLFLSGSSSAGAPAPPTGLKAVAH